jgi:Zn-dependent peptidase ImmA (M78 family)
MAVLSKVRVNKEIYIWAIEESRRDFGEIKNRFEKIEKWIAQEDHPTFRQLEKLTNYLNVPFGYMFLEKPPKTNVIESDFRTIENKIPEISKELQDTLYSMGRKKDWLSENRKEKGWEKLIPDDFNDMHAKDFNTVCQRAKEYIGLDDFWYKEHRDKGSAYKYLRDVLENKGIIVMQNGIVGSNTHRKLNVNEFRGFLLYDDIAPLIFINNNDSQAGKIFTLIHEYIHFLFQEDDIFIDKDLTIESTDEKKINRITAEFLIPGSHVKELWANNKHELEQVEELSKLFHASRLAVAIKLNDMGIINRSIVDKIKEKTKAEQKANNLESGGGNYYHNYKSRFGTSFIRTVIQGAESGDISYTYAFNILDGSAKTYDYFKEEIMGYGE